MVRYAGLALLAYAIFVDQLVHIALVTAAMGMVLFPTVWNKGEGD